MPLFSYDITPVNSLAELLHRGELLICELKTYADTYFIPVFVLNVTRFFIFCKMIIFVLI